MISIQLPDGSLKELPQGATVLELAASIGAGLARAALAASVDGKLVDLSSPLHDGAQVEILTGKNPEALGIIRHTTAHLLAQAVKQLFPAALLGIGPAIESGFYYDFDVDQPFTPDDLERIETRMREIAASDLPIIRSEMTVDEARQLFGQLDERYKCELVAGLEGETASVYRQGTFVDLCRGPHLPSTACCRAFKLTSVASAFWRGDDRNKMLQRIHGTAFADQKQLDEHLAMLEEAKKRDHRKLGRDLDLFSFSDEAGAGFAIWHPKGAMLRTILEDFERREHLRRGYDIVVGPQVLKTELWQRSGHYDNYKDNMYFTEVDEQSFGVKPMNCLSHMLIYKSRPRSYRDLPLRYFELGTVHRHERAAALHGLMRVRCFTQDDAHILCTPEQLGQEIDGVISFVRDVMAKFGFDFELELSTRPARSIGSDDDWGRATDALRGALAKSGFDFEVNEGDGAFYGPKIDIKLKDCLGRRWQCATIQCDFTLPERFDLTYTDCDGGKKRPVMVHRVILGSIERFIGVLIEHYAGSFPVWLAPVQAIVLNITDDQVPYGEKVFDMLRQAGVRVAKNFRNDKLGAKVFEAQQQKAPYLAVIGSQEAATGTVAVRLRDGSQLPAMTVGEFIARINEDVAGWR